MPPRPEDTQLHEGLCQQVDPAADRLSVVWVLPQTQAHIARGEPHRWPAEGRWPHRRHSPGIHLHHCRSCREKVGLLLRPHPRPISGHEVAPHAHSVVKGLEGEAEVGVLHQSMLLPKGTDVGLLDSGHEPFTRAARVAPGVLHGLSGIAPRRGITAKRHSYEQQPPA